MTGTNLTSSLACAVVLSFLILATLVLPTLFKLCKRSRLEELPADWLERFSPESYRPMEGLLNREDFAFLFRQPGFDFSLYRKLRQERLQIFRQYLDRMIVDFNRLHLVARLALAHSNEDHSELLVKLILLKVRFSASVLAAEFRYMLCCFGLRTLSARALISELEELSAQVHAISSPHAA